MNVPRLKSHNFNQFQCLLALALSLCAPLPVRAFLGATNQMQLGNPSGAIVDPNNHDHYLIQRAAYALDYCDNHGQPVWVSWDLTTDDVGSSGRTDAWAQDDSLPPTFYKVPTSPFSNTGYDRGHMCPSGDRTTSDATNELTFIMSNIIPQASLQNQNIWANFENYCRQTLMSGGKEVLIICGPSLFTSTKLNNGHVTVPAYTWKIAVVAPNATPGTATNRVNATSQVIALRIPNTETVAYDSWQLYRTNVLAIEADTGFRFFTALSSNLATVLRNKIDGQTPPPPAITSLSPGSGNVGSSVVLTGTNFVFATNVTFNGTSASFSIDSTTQITAVVPAGATTGTLQVRTLGGTATSASSFVVGSSTGPDLAISCSHPGNFTQGDPADTYTLIVTNIGNAASSGIITVTNFLPAGLTATAISGAGWNATLSPLSASRNDALAAGAAYPALTITVAVAANAAASVTNTATVSGGGDASAGNNTATDPTAIDAAAVPTVATGNATGVGATSATLNGTVNPNNQPATVRFEYGTTSAYGSVASVPGTLTGASSQPVSVTLPGLTAGTLYHFRVAATNLLGAVNGADNTFSTSPVGVPDLAVGLSHAGSFTQGDTGVTYTITVANTGTAASSGSVTVTDLLPAGLTATALAGSGWNVSLATLTCTRSDSLAAGGSYPAITLTVNVSANAASLVTNTATVAGGGDSNPANNTANDPTSVNPASSGGAAVTLAGWDVHSLPGGAGEYGPSPYAATTNDSHVTVEGLTRGSGVGTSNTGAARGWGGNTWIDASSTDAINNSRFATFAVTANAGYRMSFSALSRFAYRRSATGPANGLLQFQVGSGVFSNVTSFSYPSNTTAGGMLEPINLSGLSDLQNVSPGTKVTFRLVNWGGTSASGTWYIFDVTNSTALDFIVEGTVSPVVVPVANLGLSVTHAGSFTQGDTNSSYTIIVTNRGTAASAGTISVVDSLPAGLTALNLAGNGWSANLGTLTCTRSDALSAGASFPPITLTVKVATNAPASVTNVVAVSGGGESDSSDNSVADPTAIVALQPVQQWRLYYYGTTADSGPAADNAMALCGMQNLLAYALGLDPMVPATNPVTGDTSTGYLSMTVPLNPAATDISYFIEINPSLDTPAWTTNGTTIDINTPTLLQAHQTAPLTSSASGYIRLQVTRP